MKMTMKKSLFLMILMICGLAFCDKDKQERNNRMVPDFKPFDHPADKMEPTGRQARAGGPLSKVEWVAGVVPLFGKLFSGPVRLEQPEETNSNHVLVGMVVITFLAVIMFWRKGKEEKDKVDEKKEDKKKVEYTREGEEKKKEDRSRLIYCRRQTLVDNSNVFEKIEELKATTDVLIKADDHHDEPLEVPVKHKELKETSDVMVKADDDHVKPLEVTDNEMGWRTFINTEDRFEKSDFSMESEEILTPGIIITNADGNDTSDKLEENMEKEKCDLDTVEKETSPCHPPNEDNNFKENAQENLDLDIVLFLKKEKTPDFQSETGEECGEIIDKCENIYEVKIHNVDVSLIIDEEKVNCDVSNALEINNEDPQNSEPDKYICSNEAESCQSDEICREPKAALPNSLQNGFSSDLTSEKEESEEISDIKSCRLSQEHPISTNTETQKHTDIMDSNKNGEELANGQSNTVYNNSLLETSQSEEKVLEEPEYITKIKTFKITKSPKLHQADLVQFGPGDGVVEVLEVTLLRKEEDLKISLKSASAEVNTEGANTSRLKITVVLKKNEDECLSTTMTLKEYLVSMSNKIIEEAMRRVRTDCSLDNIKHLEATIKRYRPESADMKIQSL